MDDRASKSPVGKILYLSYDGLTDPLGQSQILPYLEGLSAKGHKITVISCEKSEPFTRLKELILSRCKKHNLTWHPLKYHKHPSVLSTMYDVFKMTRASLKLHRQEKYDIVHCRSYVTALVGLKLKRFGLRFIFDMRGFWADERVEGNVWNLSNPLFRLVFNFFKRKEKQFLKTSDRTIALTENAANEIKSWGTFSPITVIPCCVDTNHFDPGKIIPQAQDQLRKELGLKKSDFVLLYLGSWGTWYLTNEMLAFFSQIKQLEKNAKFLILSQDAVNLNGSSYANDVILRSVPREKVPLHISVASAAVFFIKPSFSKKASSATKMGELLAMNIPVITNRGWGDVEAIAQQTQLYFNDNFADVESIAPSDTRTYCFQYLSLENGVNLYNSVYRALLIKHVKLGYDRNR